jgi:microcystin-dependent protein
MSNLPFLGQIQIFSFNFAPKSWAMCNGQFLPINQNQPLFALLGTTYGGDGRVTFQLPDLRGRVPIYTGQGFTLGERGGEAAHTLTISEMPTHSHPITASTNGPTVSPTTNNFWASNTSFSPYSSVLNAQMAPNSFSNSGGSQPHENRSPYLALNFCIALFGLFPSRN